MITAWDRFLGRGLVFFPIHDQGLPDIPKQADFELLRTLENVGNCRHQIMARPSEQMIGLLVYFYTGFNSLKKEPDCSFRPIQSPTGGVASGGVTVGLVGQAWP
jgi:hypothetical protein